MANMETSWFPAAYRDSLPYHAVVASSGNAGKILVGRVFLDDEMLPAMVVPQQSYAFVTKNGREYKKSKYDVLVGHNYSWQQCCNKEIPINAVAFDNQKSNAKIYIGRILYKDSIYVGRIESPQNDLYFPYQGQEFFADTFDILVMDKSEDWISTSFHYTPADAVEGGRDTDGAMIYVGRAFYCGQWLPAKVIPSKTCAYVCHDGMEVFVRDYEVLRGQAYLWHHVYGHFIPPNAVTIGTTVDGEPLYVGRGNYKGSITPGLISVARKCCDLPYGGRTISVTDYEILIR